MKREKGRPTKIEALATIDLSDDDKMQSLVETMWLRQSTASQVASDLKIPKVEAQQRLNVVQKKFAEIKLSSEWIRNQWFQLTNRSRERYEKLETLYKDKFDPLDCIRHMRDEDKHMSYLLSQVERGAAEVPKSISQLETEEVVETKSIGSSIIERFESASRNWTTTESLTMSRKSIEMATKSEGVLGYDNEDDEEDD